MMPDLSAALTPRRILWTALVTVLAASAVHVAGTFSTLEPGGALPVLARLGPYTGVLAAIAVDLGLLGLSWSVGARKRAGQDTQDLWVGIAIFAALSALANLDHALAVLGQHPPFAAGMGETGAATWAALDRYARVKVLALSATLPLLAVYLTRCVETAVDARQDTATQGAPATAPATAPIAPAETSFPELAPVSSTGPDAPAAPTRGGLNGHGDGALVPEIDVPVHINGIGTVTIPPGAPPYLPNPKPRPLRSARHAKLTPERYRALAAEHVLPGTGAQEADRIVARVARVSTKTAQRARLALP